MGIRANVHLRDVDSDELRQQIKDLLESNIPEASKNGIHHLLGEILDTLNDLERDDINNQIVSIDEV